MDHLNTNHLLCYLKSKTSYYVMLDDFSKKILDFKICMEVITHWCFQKIDYWYTLNNFHLKMNSQLNYLILANNIES